MSLINKAFSGTGCLRMGQFLELGKKLIAKSLLSSKGRSQWKDNDLVEESRAALMVESVCDAGDPGVRKIP